MYLKHFHAKTISTWIALFEIQVLLIAVNLLEIYL